MTPPLAHPLDPVPLTHRHTPPRIAPAPTFSIYLLPVPGHVPFPSLTANWDGASHPPHPHRDKPSHTNSCQALVEWGHGKTYSPPNRSERRRVGATLPGGQRAARTQLVADPVAAGAWAVGQGHRREHRLLALLDWPDRQALQRRGP